MNKEELNRIEQLKHYENLLFMLVDNLQCYFNDNERFIDYLIKKVGFTDNDIKAIVYLEEVNNNE